MFDYPCNGAIDFLFAILVTSDSTQTLVRLRALPYSVPQHTPTMCIKGVNIQNFWNRNRPILVRTEPEPDRNREPGTGRTVPNCIVDWNHMVTQSLGYYRN